MNGFINRIRENNRRRTAYRQIVDELSQLSPRELSDIGLAPGDISEVARHAVYG